MWLCFHCKFRSNCPYIEKSKDIHHALLDSKNSDLSKEVHKLLDKLRDKVIKDFGVRCSFGLDYGLSVCEKFESYLIDE